MRAIRRDFQRSGRGSRSINRDDIRSAGGIGAELLEGVTEVLRRFGDTAQNRVLINEAFEAYEDVLRSAGLDLKKSDDYDRYDDHSDHPPGSGWGNIFIGQKVGRFGEM